MCRLNRDPVFRAANGKRASKRLKRLHADPAFKAVLRAANRRLHADPEFAEANRERMRRKNADPMFRAKQRAARSIPSATRAAIIAALKADPHAKRVTKQIDGASYKTVLRIAKATGIKLTKGGPPQSSGRTPRRTSPQKGGNFP